MQYRNHNTSLRSNLPNKQHSQQLAPNQAEYAAAASYKHIQQKQGSKAVNFTSTANTNLQENTWQDLSCLSKESMLQLLQIQISG